MNEIAVEALLVSFSVIIGILGRNFGKLIAPGIFDTLYLLPILISQDLFGLKSGILCLFLSCLIKSVFFSQSGIIGFLIRISFVVYMFFRKQKNEEILKVTLFDFLGLALTLVSQMPFLIIYYKSSFGVQNWGMILFSTIMDVVKLGAVVIISRVIDLRKLKLS